MKQTLLVQLLKSPQVVKHFSNADWNQLLLQAYATDMLLRVEAQLTTHDLMPHVPDKIKRHFNSERVKVKHLHRQVNEEVRLLNKVFTQLNISPIYLKGAAYLLADLPLAASRSFGDIDILLTEELITEVEHALKYHGWFSQKTDDYDQAYYRNHMHEIPPMQNIDRGAVLDIHHNILPVCNNSKIDIEELTHNKIAIARAATPKSNAQEYVLSPEAMFLHSAIHLFHEGEFDKGLRGLSDLDGLLTHFQTLDVNFVERTILLAKKINHQQSLYFAWRYLQRILGRQLCPKAVHFLADYQPQIKHAAINDFIFDHQLNAYQGINKTWQYTLSAQLAYWRGHLLRMPLGLLIPHLIKKAWFKQKAALTKKPKAQQKISALNPRFNVEDND